MTDPCNKVPVWDKILLCWLVVALALHLPACKDLKKDFLCRPAGQCINAPIEMPPLVVAERRSARSLQRVAAGARF
jgi:hypothetical protein